MRMTVVYSVGTNPEKITEVIEVNNWGEAGAMHTLREKYPNIEDNGCVIHDTVNEVISRINRTEYKRKGLPIVIPREKYMERLT